MFVPSRAQAAAMACLLSTLAGPALAQNLDGVAAAPSTPFPFVRQQTAPPPQAAAVANFIDFNDLPEPCNFNMTVALRNKYGGSHGVFFDGPAPLDGAAILDECGNFGVSGHSSPNFLALNVAATLSDGGKPQGPETIKFAYPVSAVKILAARGTTIKMEAFDAGGNSIASNSISGTTVMQSLGVAAPGIRSVVISFSGNVCVLDDLAWAPEPPVTYCTAKTGLVCGTPSIGWSGAPSASMASGFDIISKPARDNRVGILLYSDGGRNNVPFQGGILCVGVPLRRSVPVKSGGNPSQCDGAFVLDMNAFASGNAGGNPQAYLLVVGTMVNTQWWGRDSVSTGSFLSDGLEYYVLP
jgi:hypothetical protein